MIKHALLPCLAVAAAAYPPATYSKNFTDASTRLRAALMQGYDKHVPPLSDRAAGGVTYSAAGADIAMQVRFFKVESVRASHGDMRLKVWLRTCAIAT